MAPTQGFHVCGEDVAGALTWVSLQVATEDFHRQVGVIAPILTAGSLAIGTHSAHHRGDGGIGRFGQRRCRFRTLCPPNIPMLGRLAEQPSKVVAESTASPLRQVRDACGIRRNDRHGIGIRLRDAQGRGTFVAQGCALFSMALPAGVRARGVLSLRPAGMTRNTTVCPSAAGPAAAGRFCTWRVPADATISIGIAHGHRHRRPVPRQPTKACGRKNTVLDREGWELPRKWPNHFLRYRAKYIVRRSVQTQAYDQADCGN